MNTTTNLHYHLCSYPVSGIFEQGVSKTSYSKTFLVRNDSPARDLSEVMVEGWLGLAMEPPEK